MEKNKFWSSTKIRLELLLFLIYINDLPDELTSICKIFADHTSLFSKFFNINESANDLDIDLEKISQWAYQ